MCTAALLYLREAQRTLPKNSAQMRRIADVARAITDSSLTLRFLRCRILQRAGEDVRDEAEVFLRQEVAGDIFLDNLKIAAPWVSKVVGIELLKAQAEQRHTDNMRHICAH